ncbi:unnamed protein product, partial [Staurois parvus]
HPSPPHLREPSTTTSPQLIPGNKSQALHTPSSNPQPLSDPTWSPCCLCPPFHPFFKGAELPPENRCCLPERCRPRQMPCLPCGKYAP